MPPTSDGIRTVGCALSKLVLEATHLERLQNAVLSVHKATILATELVNMHLRRCLAGEADTDLKLFFDGSWLLNAYNEVTTGKRDTKVITALRETKEACMPYFDAPDRVGIQQCILYDARNIATVAANGIWMTFQKKVLSHVREKHSLSEEEFKTTSHDERRARKLCIIQMAADICRHPSTSYQSPADKRDWVDAERKRLGIDEAVEDWQDKAILYHLKSKPHRFLPCVYIMSKEREEAGKSAFSLYPLRRNFVPRHVRFDQKALRDLLHLGSSDYIKSLSKQRERKRKLDDTQDGEGGEDRNDSISNTVSGKRRSKEEMKEENQALFQKVLNLRAAGVQRRHRFDFAFTTDGVTARVQMRATPRANGSPTTLPKRGVWAIDEVKRLSRMSDVHVVGVDPGKRELVVCADMDAPVSTPVRYTQKQRLRDLRSRQYADEGKREKPEDVKDFQASLCGFNSRSHDLSSFCAYCGKRHKGMEACLAFYTQLGHRRRRWKRAIKEQQSEERLYRRLDTLRKDDRTLVLAYGSWGLVAGRSGAACNKGNPPCIGVGLMRKMARRFVVCPTPEAYTSKTCCKCFGECGPWTELEEARGHRIRGLRRCTQQDCMLVMNRDKMGAINIGTNFMRAMQDRPPVRSMTDEDMAFHRASLCMECD